MATFQALFDAHGLFYRVDFCEQNQIQDFVVIATSDPATINEYIRKKLFQHLVLHEAAQPNLIPCRRSDMTPVTDLHPDVDGFYRQYGLFHLLMTPARISQNSYLAIVAWRPEQASDFNDAEKDRLGLLMRYLMALLSVQEFLPEHDAGCRDEALLQFADHYRLTKSETGILHHLLRGKTLKEIAATTGRSYGTVRWHTRNLLEKCQVSSQRNLINAYYRSVAD